LESVRRSHVNQFLGPEPQVSDRATSNHAPGWWVQIGDKLGSYRHAFNRAAASRISVSGPQYEKRKKRLPRAWSKSTPGVAAIPTSASMRVQNAALSFDRSVMSAKR
jgi:hypothetical protein